MQLLTRQDMYRIHLQMLEILRDPGLEMELPPESLKHVGACEGIHVLSPEGKIQLDPQPVLETLRQFTGAAEPEIHEQGSVNPEQPLRFPKKLLAQVGSTHAYVFDCDAWALKPVTHDDLRDFIKLRHGLPEVYQSNIGMIPQDVPSAVSFIHAMALSAKYQTSPSMLPCNGPEDAEWIERIRELIGQPEPFYPLPLVTPPLRLQKEAVRSILYGIEKGCLPMVMAMGMPGINGPVTLAGTLAVTLAEILGFNTLVRLLAEPPDNVFSPRAIGCDMGVMDPRRANICGARPEGMLLRLALRQIMGEFYRTPGGSGFIVGQVTDAAEPGIQASIEQTINVTTEVFNGFYSYGEAFTPVLKTLGRLQTNLCLCKEQVLIDYEIFQWLQRFIKGISVDEDSLALDTIREVGAGGSFLASSHTRQNYRSVLWQPCLFHDGPWQTWLDTGKKSPLEKAKEQIQELLKKDLEPVIPDDAIRELDNLVIDAEKALLGTVTGVRL